ncbi:Arylsulfatase [Pirellulimonas nuda]|uniref:Arylsulfatase n=1 Tax=Pirellulimonas nuda TaxID=2528009 RepID=A0A518DJ27_9BACT|nr:sulfatase [Pirellulimonas nuda]QDU91473.1 Arylsulfatase [Pirellulimonas nuda]
MGRLLAAFAVVAGALGGPCELTASSARAAERNILFIVADDHGADAGCYGNPVIQTPALDALADEGMVFDRAYCTTASCSASRSVILTGLHNHLNGQYGHQHDFHKFSAWTNLISLPQYLASAGYRTARCGKFHVEPESVFRFDSVLKDTGRKTVAQAEACREFLSADADKPFLLYWCTHDPHRSGGVNNGSPYKPNRFGNEGKYAGVKTVEFAPEDVVVPPFLPDTPECRAELAEYYQSVSRLDQGVGRLVQILKDADLLDKTLIVYISDHGIAMPGAKTTLYEPGMRSPLIVRDPYATLRGVRSDAMVSWVDLTPTLLDFAGALTEEGAATPKVARPLAGELRARPAGQRSPHLKPGRFHGRSFLPIIEAKTEAGLDPPGWDEVFASHTFHEITMYYPMRVVHEDRLKLIWNIAYPLPYPFASDLWAAPTWQAQFRQGMDAPYGPRSVGQYIHRPQFELFDTQADPYEAKNLAEDPSYKPELDRLKQKLKAFQQETDDPWIMKWDYE